jgi:hypothetical protein
MHKLKEETAHWTRHEMRSPMWATEEEMVSLLTSVSLRFVGVGRCERGRRIERQRGNREHEVGHGHNEEGSGVTATTKKGARKCSQVITCVV